MSAPSETNDLELLALAQSGDQSAYGQLVSRHQTLVVSLAYSICGDFARSQDLAQEAFITAWRQLGALEDAAKFKAWLCGITRNLGHNFVRQQTLRADRPDASLEATAEAVADSPSPHDHAVTREEASIVWRALEQLPETYREPLILFYREHHSVERVATALDLSEDTVKQRLSRGRGMLRDQVENLVERSLGFTTPGVMFTTAVLSALPLAATQIAVATTAGTAAKGGAMAKASLSLAWLSLGLIPVLNIAASWFAGRQLLKQARNPGEHAFFKRLVWASGLISAIMVIGILALHQWDFARLKNYKEQLVQSLPQSRPLSVPGVRGSDTEKTVEEVIVQHRQQRPAPYDTKTPALVLLGWTGLCFTASVIVALWSGRRYLAFYREWRPAENIRRRRFMLHFYPSRALAYRSKLTAFGLPLVDIRFGHSPDEPVLRGTARGWIAIGDIAHGVVFALGGFATGGIALGGVAVGVVSMGGLSLGLLALGIVAVGGVANAFLLAVGYEAFGVLLGFGFEAATGLVAVAKHIAADGSLFAAADHVRDSVAREWSDTGMLPWIFKVTLYPRIFSGQFAAMVIATLTLTALARRPRAHVSGERIADRARLLPSLLGVLLMLALIGLGLNAANGLNARRLVAEQEALIARARETVLHAPNEEARVRAHHELAKTLVQTGRPDAALSEFLWCLDEGAVHAPEFYWTRLTSLLPDLQRLGDVYPPARAALIERRDHVQSVFQAGQATENSVDEIVALNRSLHESNRSLALYDQLPAVDPLRPKLRRYLSFQFLNARRYDEAIKVEPLKRILKGWAAIQKYESLNASPAFSPPALQKIHNENVHWLADHLEALAGAGRIGNVREMLEAALVYDGTEAARAIYRTGLERAGQAGLLNSNAPPTALDH